jgi:phosphotriesterase-related protein
MQAKTPPQRLITVTGAIEPSQARVTDAHNHVWIEAVTGAVHPGPVLDDRDAITRELQDFHIAGGSTIVDCQPGGCGRNGRVMQALSEASQVNIIAATGYHLRRYYPEDFWLFQSSAQAAYQYFLDELTKGLTETQNSQLPVQAGFIKIACEESLLKSPLHLVEAAVQTSLETGAALEVHTEKGADVENIINALYNYGLSTDRLVLCHVDKRADFGFHRAMAQEGILLEYDTFYRPKYHPEENVWLLLGSMVEAGFGSQICLATDMADARMWARLGEGPGLTGLMEDIIPRLAAYGFEAPIINQLTGDNITRWLSRPIH